MNDHRPTADLAPHHKVKHLLGRWRPDSEEMLALRRSIQERGIISPLVVTPDNYILDGVTRWQAAKALQLETVPVTVRPEIEALDIVIHSELHRRHQSKSQLAFRLVPFIEEAFQVAKQREIHGGAATRFQSADPANSIRRPEPQPLTQETGKSGTLFSAKTVAEYAGQLGVSIRLLEQAHELHQLFGRHSEEWEWQEDALRAIGYDAGQKLTFRDYFTPHIIEFDMSLGGALTGLKTRLEMARAAERGREHTGGRPKAGEKVGCGVEKSKQLALIQEAWVGVTARWRYWQDLAQDEREQVGAKVAEAIHAAPDDVLAAMRRAVDVEWKRRREGS